MSLSPDQKKAAALKLRDEGLRPYEIAERLGIEDSTVRTWLSRAPKTGTSCVKCDETLNESPDAFCGWCREQLVADLVRPDHRAEAIRALRRGGYSAESVAAAVAEVARRKTASEILEVLLGKGERVGSAA